MRYVTIPLALALLVACADTDTEAAADAEGATEQAPPIEASPPTPVGLLGVDTLASGTGVFLTDAGGRALYTLEGEDDPSACVDACTQAWPPYTRSGAADLEATVRSAGLDAEQVDQVERPDGTTQVTYGGHPLYYYARDAAPGDTTGQDVTDEWGEWYLVQPSGELQEEHAEAEGGES